MICMFKAIHNCQLMQLRTFEISLQIYNLVATKFHSVPGLIWQAALKTTNIKLDHLTDINMLLMVEKGIREGI